MCIYNYTCTGVCVCVYIFMCVYIYTHLYVCVYIYTYGLDRFCIYPRLRIDRHTCASIYMHIDGSVGVYIHVCK